MGARGILLTNAARLSLLAVIAGMVTASSPSGSAAPAGDARISIQVANPDANASIRVLLDRKVIFEGVPARSPLGNTPTPPTVVGTIAVTAESRHELVAEVDGTGTRARLQWTPRIDGSAWVVIHYYPGRSKPEQPPFIMFSLQASPYKVR